MLIKINADGVVDIISAARECENLKCPANLNCGLEERIGHFKPVSHNIGTHILLGVSLQKYACSNYFDA